MAKPLFSFGVNTDVQYAREPNGFSYGGRARYYRNALVALRRAVDDWRQQDLAFVIHLGDIIDGKAIREKDGALDDVLAEFKRLETPVLHVLGNHCFYNFSRPELNQRLRIQCTDPTSEGGSHYCFRPRPGFRVVVIDGYDISMLGWEKGHPHHELAKGLLDMHNPNEEKNSPSSLVGVARRWVKFGGGVGEAQLRWLAGQLDQAEQEGERVIVCCHLPMHPASSNPATLLWNYNQLLALLGERTNVVATLAGHAHRDGYAVEDGLHHRVLNCVVETEPDVLCHGVVHVYEDRMVLEGRGALGSTTMPFRPMQRRQQQHAAVAADAVSSHGIVHMEIDV